MTAASSPDVTLIVGGSGFLGTYLAEACVAQGATLVGVDMRPPLRPHPWLQFAEGQASGVDYHALVGNRRLRTCFFLAGSASVAQSLSHPYSDFSALVPAVARLLDYVRSYQADTHVVYYSSAAVYGNPASLPVRESDPAMPITPYGAHKHLVETMLSHYARIYSVTSSALRIFSAYGALNGRMLFWDLLQKWRIAQRDGASAITAFGTGEETRDFIHARDVASAAVAVSNHPVKGQAQVINVACGEQVTIRDAGAKLLSNLPHKSSLQFTGEVRAGDPRNWVADVTRLRTLGWRPTTTLDDGLREYAQWFQDQTHIG